MTGASGGLPRCGTCGEVTTRRPVFHRGRWFCCAGCAQGLTCHCGWDLPTGRLGEPPLPPRVDRATRGRGIPIPFREDRPRAV